MSKRQKRFEVLAQRPVNKDGFIKEWIDVGLVAMDSPKDPTPGIKIQNGKVVELDGKSRENFDMIDLWIADHFINTSVAEEAMAIDSTQFARMLVDINVPRSKIVRLSVGMTPAKVLEVFNKMNVVELMMAMQKLRPRRTPSNQACCSATWGWSRAWWPASRPSWDRVPTSSPRVGWPKSSPARLRS